MEVLPTRYGLSHLVPTIRATCGLCGEAKELHVLAECGLAKRGVGGLRVATQGFQGAALRRGLVVPHVRYFGE